MIAPSRPGAAEPPTNALQSHNCCFLVVRQDTYTSLAEDVRALVDQIEKHVGFEIEVKPLRDYFGGGQRALDGDDTVGVMTSAKSIAILSPTEIEDITEDDFIHELLHLRRSYVQQVPHIFAKAPANGNVASAVDNWLEHAVIYGEHMDMRPAYREKTDKGIAEFWEKCPWGADGQTLRFNLLSRYIVTRLHCGDRAKDAMATALQSLSPPINVRDAARRCTRAINDKPALLKEMLAFCNIPTRRFWLRHYERGKDQAVWRDLD